MPQGPTTPKDSLLEEEKSDASLPTHQETSLDEHIQIDSPPKPTSSTGMSQATSSKNDYDEISSQQERYTQSMREATQSKLMKDTTDKDYNSSNPLKRSRSQNLRSAIHRNLKKIKVTEWKSVPSLIERPLNFAQSVGKKIPLVIIPPTPSEYRERNNKKRNELKELSRPQLEIKELERRKRQSISIEKQDASRQHKTLNDDQENVQFVKELAEAVSDSYDRDLGRENDEERWFSDPLPFPEPRHQLKPNGPKMNFDELETLTISQKDSRPYVILPERKIKALEIKSKVIDPVAEPTKQNSNSSREVIQSNSSSTPSSRGNSDDHQNTTKNDLDRKTKVIDCSSNAYDHLSDEEYFRKFSVDIPPSDEKEDDGSPWSNDNRRFTPRLPVPGEISPASSASRTTFLRHPGSSFPPEYWDFSLTSQERRRVRIIEERENLDPEFEDDLFPSQEKAFVDDEDEYDE